MLYTEKETETLKSHTFAHLLVEEENHLLTITLNRPEKKNAMNPVIIRELAYTLAYAHHNVNIWAVVIAAKGDVFCAGADLRSFSNTNPETSISTIPEPDSEIVFGDIFLQLHKPCIAKVNASVYAGGFLIICGCTHVIATPEVKFGLPEAKRGIWPFQVMQSMLQIMPARTVIDFCMRARTIDAKEAEKLGLVSQIVSADKLDETVQNLINEISQYSPSAIRLGLKAYDKLKTKTAAEAHSYLKQMLMEVVQTDDAKEGIAAFAEKRKPVWIGK
jgi:enoyl-CoA hydratase/carnithine racemase